MKTMTSEQECEGDFTMNELKWVIATGSGKTACEDDIHKTSWPQGMCLPPDSLQQMLTRQRLFNQMVDINSQTPS